MFATNQKSGRGHKEDHVIISSIGLDVQDQKFDSNFIKVLNVSFIFKKCLTAFFPYKFYITNIKLVSVISGGFVWTWGG